MNANETENAILGVSTVRLIVYTDGAGTITRTTSPQSPPESTLIERLDLVTAAAAELGQSQSLGDLRIGLLVFRNAMVLAGALPGGAVYVLCDAELASLGLLLSHLRTLVALGPEGVNR
jgi:hypothetical protein